MFSDSQSRQIGSLIIRAGKLYNYCALVVRAGKVAAVSKRSDGSPQRAPFGKGCEDQI